MQDGWRARGTRFKRGNRQPEVASKQGARWRTLAGVAVAELHRSSCGSPIDWQTAKEMQPRAGPGGVLNSGNVLPMSIWMRAVQAYSPRILLKLGGSAALAQTCCGPYIRGQTQFLKPQLGGSPTETKAPTGPKGSQCVLWNPSCPFPLDPGRTK